MPTTTGNICHMRKDEILSSLSTVNMSERASKRRNELIEIVLHIQQQVGNGEMVLITPTGEAVSEAVREKRD